MRLLLDLQGCQAVAASGANEWIALVFDLLDRATANDTLVLLDSRFPDSVETLRHALLDRLPAENIKVLHNPLAYAELPSQRLIESAELLRVNVINSFRVEFVFVANAFAPHVYCATNFAEANFQTILHYAPADLLAPIAGLDDYLEWLRQKQLAMLKHATLCFPTSRYTPRIGAELWQSLTTLPRSAEMASRPSRPKLAYLSPLPPAKSGIAEYSRELIPYLSEYYCIDLIVMQGFNVDPSIQAEYRVRDVAWFKLNYQSYDRVIYHMGNSIAHMHMFDLIQHYPGVIVLHDFFLGHVLEHMDLSSERAGAVAEALYKSHGWKAFDGWRGRNVEGVKWRYPMCRHLLDCAEGVIVHSAFSSQLAADYFGPDYAGAWSIIPMVRRLQKAHPRVVARRKLGLSTDDFIVCAFGVLGPTKLNHRLLDAWLASPLGAAGDCRLIFVGENDPGDYGSALSERVAGSSALVAITGFVESEDFKLYLSACDLAVQLRAHSRGETSSAVLDCFSYGVPVIVNANGSFAELPDSTVFKLDDEFCDEQLSAALKLLSEDAEGRSSLTASARAYLGERHQPVEVARQYFEAIEGFHRQSSHTLRRELMSAVYPTTLNADPDPLALLSFSRAFDESSLRTHDRRLFVDVTALAQHDLKTGIQRVVRNVLQALREITPPWLRLEPVYSKPDGAGYFYARSFFLEVLGVTCDLLQDTPVDPAVGDIFLGLDLVTGGTISNAEHLRQLRADGVQVFFVIYDLLPLSHPGFFPEPFVQEFKSWVETVTLVADGVFCISRAVADELRCYLADNPSVRATPLNVGWFHLGADIEVGVSVRGVTASEQAMIAKLAEKKSFLMVGTVEPRKGHAQALDAFEILWREGIDVCLVIIGKQGWSVEPLSEKLRTHPQLGKTLFWLESASDDALFQIYRRVNALLAASEGEGFGLPLVEAAKASLPIIARNLPVFREVAGDHAFYFDGRSAEDLAADLKQWLKLHEQGEVPSSGPVRCLSWEDSAHMLLEQILARGVRRPR